MLKSVTGGGSKAISEMLAFNHLLAILKGLWLVMFTLSALPMSFERLIEVLSEYHGVPASIESLYTLCMPYISSQWLTCALWLRQSQSKSLSVPNLESSAAKF